MNGEADCMAALFMLAHTVSVTLPDLHAPGLWRSAACLAFLLSPGSIVVLHLLGRMQGWLSDAVCQVSHLREASQGLQGQVPRQG